MSYEQYWFGNAELVIPYRKKKYLETQEQNQIAWLQGLYFYNAIVTVMSCAFNGSKDTYLKQPLDIMPKTEQDLIAERKQKQDAAIRELDKWAKRWELAERDKNGNS